MVKVVHLTSAHARRDTRIFLKQCRSLAAAGYEVHLVVADGLGDSAEAGVTFRDVGKAAGRLQRMAGSAYKVFAAGLRLDADVYHLHDPELLPYALALKAKGKRVIFDAHEDLPAQVLTKPYLQPALRRTIAQLVSTGERIAVRRLDAVVGATPHITQKFEQMGVARAVEINNFPLPGELESPATGKSKVNAVCYVGGISRIRGIVEVVNAIGLSRTGARLKLAGGFAPASLRSEVTRLSGWDHVDELGIVDREGVRDLLAESVAGLVTFLPAPNHIDAQPNKMFEYMSAGLPVIASDFPLWRTIIAGNNCGLLVEPQNPQAIANAIDRLFEDSGMARRMGENGSKAVREKYNWGMEEKRLLALYEELVGPPS
ncbi:MAG: glycosyltransferase family 4 protein [Rhizobiaceae bacterium]|nr:glycosyltransferase family 4 protein [Rhizobiaceae bacterium]